ncbi:UNVERIFIED_CONTAM: hypothetical protein FKN15_059723 [Acipenser sinensis]
MKGDADFEEFKSERWYDTESPHKASSSLISESEFSCHCCYHILLNPTTLNCGHSFCRHCLALWDAVEKLFPEVVVARRGEVDSSPRIVQSLCAFQRYGDDQASQGLNPLSGHRPRGSGFFSGVLTALTCVAVVLLVYHWSSREVQQDLLLHKPVTKWTAEDVILWLEQLGPWASLYKERFLEEQVNGRHGLFQVVLLGYHWSSREAQQDLLHHKPVTKWTAEDVILWLEQLGPWASLYKERFLEEQVNGR